MDLARGLGAEELAAIWEAALSDAGIAADNAVLFAFPGGQSNGGYQAKTWLRGSTIDDPDDCAALGVRLPVANEDMYRTKCRVAIWTDRSPEGISALLRHELEHCLQLDAHGHRLQLLHDRAVAVLSHHAGGLPGSGLLYNVIPMEADANAAAGVFVRSRFGDDRIDALIRGDDKDAAALRPKAPPPPIESLEERMTRFIKVDGPQVAQDFKARFDRSIDPPPSSVLDGQ